MACVLFMRLLDGSGKRKVELAVFEGVRRYRTMDAKPASLACKTCQARKELRHVVALDLHDRRIERRHAKSGIRSHPSLGEVLTKLVLYHGPLTPPNRGPQPGNNVGGVGRIESR